jgi:diguanylate cyclase (GGDEF)-like protein
MTAPLRLPLRIAMATCAGVSCALLAAAVAGAGSGAPSSPPRLDPFNKTAYAFRVFRDSEGLPQNTVHAITVDHRGRLWVGTQDGAAYYDGRRWTVVDMPSRLRSNFVRTILGASDGSVWFGTRAAGLFRLHDGAWTAVDALAKLSDCLRINALVETRAESGRSVVWAATYGGGIGRFEDGTWRLYTTADGLPSNLVWALYAQHEPVHGTTIWAGTEQGLARLSPGASRFRCEPEFPKGSVNSLAGTVGPGGNSILWAGAYGGGLARFEGGQWSRLRRADGLPSDFVTSIVTAGRGPGPITVWVGTDGGGLARIVGSTIEVIDARVGLPSEAVYSLLETHPTNGPSVLWVGTRNGGLAQLTEGTWRKALPVVQAPSAPVNSILETAEADGAKAIWLGTDGDGLERLLDGRWARISRGTGKLPSDTVQCLLETHDLGSGTTLWVGTRNGGLAALRDGQWSTFSAASGALPNNMVQALAETRDADGGRSLWVGTRHGLARLRRGRWTAVGAKDGLPDDSVTCLLADGDGRGADTVWAGTAAGLAVLDGDTWRVHEATSELLNTTVQCLMEQQRPHRRRTLWVGTDGGGLSVLDLSDGGKLLFTLTDSTSPALPNNVIYQILEDTWGRIYLLTNKGVVRLAHIGGDGGAASDYALSSFTAEDGLPLNEGNRGAGIVDSRGRIWVGTIGGAAVFDPAAESPDRSPDLLTLDASYGDDGSPLSAGTALEHDRRHVVFRYALLSFFHEDETRYRTQLVGLDAQPSSWMTDVKREYRTLGRGRYTFRVWGRDYAGNVTGPAEHSFMIRPAPWQTWWALALLAGILSLAAYGSLQLRLRTHRGRERRLRALVETRTRRLAEANQLLVELSYADSLTGVGNRRRFDELIEVEWRRAARAGQPLALVLLDIDFFKPFNDAYGHPRGDECLKSVAAGLADALPRAGDSVARYGGDEFAVVLPDTDLAGALKVATQLQMAVTALRLEHGISPAGRHLTVSCGVAALMPSADGEPLQLVTLADRGLYKAKHAGRNCVAAAEE